MGSRPYFYRAHGIDWESEFKLDGFGPASGPATVHVRLGDVPESLQSVSLQGVLFQATEGELLLNFKSVGRFLVSQGREIRYQPSEIGSPRLAQHFLLGAPLAALLHHRRTLALHAGAVRNHRGAALLCGASASGKSTLAAALSLRGYGWISDEACAITGIGECPLVHTGGWNCYLSPNSIDQLAIPQSRIGFVRGNHPKRPYLVHGSGPAEAHPIDTIYILKQTASEPGITELKGFEKVAAVVRCVFHLRLLPSQAREHVPNTTLLCQKTRVCMVNRPHGHSDIGHLADSIEKDFDR